MHSQHRATCCFAVATRDHPLLLLDAYDGSVRASYTAIADGDVTTAPHSTTFSPTGSHLYGGMLNKIAVFDVSIQGTHPVSYIATTPTRKSAHGQKGILSHIHTSPSHPSLLLTGSFNRNFCIYDTTCAEPVSLVTGLIGTGVTQVEFGIRDPNLVLISSRKSTTLQLFDMRYLSESVVEPVFELSRNAYTNQRVGFSQSPCGRFLLSGDADGNVLTFDLSDGSLISTTHVSDETVGGVAVHPYYAMAEATTITAVSGDGSGTVKDAPPASSSHEPPPKMTYWVAACSGERREIRVRQPYDSSTSSDSDSSDEETRGIKRTTGTHAEINLFQFVQ
ncbi:hypothetical protein HDU98_011210 [Podochytrium sp. JEL0797]|nr:hypothetical protein HDU98_011210 [Podochytrium sp. JEL0797]